MSQKPTLATVAQKAGVSIPTVSQVLRGTGRISDETRQRVLRAAKILHYVTDQKAAAMRSGENREIGFVINQLSNPFNAEVISGVVDLLDGEGYLVSILDTRDNGERQSHQLKSFIQHGRGGLIWVPAADTADETFTLLKAHKIPTVTFLRNMRADLDHVGIRNAEATQTATQHLLQLGHRNIAYLGGTDMTPVRKDRILGYQRALMAQNLGQGTIWDCADNKLAGLEAMLTLLQKHPQITAVVCTGDMVALGACLGLQQAGLTPGKEVSVTGFDDIQDAAVATPPLTTMAVRPHALGGQLARMLLARIRNPDRPATVSEVRAELIVRNTTGAPQHGRPSRENR